ncbi:Uncharacterized protein conserved in bacteria (plasmid) [Legionella adelaidensis]|uniref:Uncharacterized protein conserved in bacteria n=1 Tax=Legionella adelaidensis TaxID=45056 RepID=A0A0W0R5V0_9GAMM|nr:DUF494 family protein [Legionella adelaidensis]KTC66410.1 hypothetical protein Lade_1068 [Legionella adelaidensis]VEH85008.1 Uncharacterized protein conserved in bacteria [Legionella adelaidensis]
MKDSLFEMLLSLFEKTLAQLKETRVMKDQETASLENVDDTQADNTMVLTKDDLTMNVIKSASIEATRVLTNDERVKLTKASYQFLMRLHNLEIISADELEKILNQLQFSDSRFVGLQETKWIIRNTLADSLAAEQLAFLDLVLYQKEDGLTLH